jgi:glycosyltransferase involved in cell wall biosynthesis
MKKMNITILDFDDIKNPYLGAGQAKATLEVGKRLAKKGHKITVICSRYPGSKDRREDGITYKHIGISSKNIKVSNLFYILLLPFTLRSIKADVIMECFTAPVTTLLSPLFTKIPVVALSTSFEAERFAKMYHLPFDRIEKKGLKLYRYYIALSEFFEGKMKKYNPNVVSTVIPEGVGPEFFAIKRKTPKHILFLGRLDMGQKGIDLLLKSYAKIASKSKYPLVIVGNGPDEKRIQTMIEEMKLSDSVKMVGPAYGEKKAKYLSEALFIAFSSRNETFSCFALEALASGLPLVAFDIPGIAWSGNEVAIKAKAFNTADYARLLLASQNESKMKILGRKARNFAKGFTWEFVADEFEKFFSYVVEKERGNYAIK